MPLTLRVRKVFATSDGRICGTDREFEFFWLSSDQGYTWRSQPPATRVFESREEADEWKEAINGLPPLPSNPWMDAAVATCHWLS